MCKVLAGQDQGAHVIQNCFKAWIHDHCILSFINWLTGWLAGWLVPWSRVLLEKSVSSPANQESPCILLNVEGSVLCSKQSATCPYPEPDYSSSCFPILFFKINSNIILPSMHSSSNWSLSFRFSFQNPVVISLLSPYVPHVLTICHSCIILKTIYDVYDLTSSHMKIIQLHYRFVLYHSLLLLSGTSYFMHCTGWTQIISTI